MSLVFYDPEDWLETLTRVLKSYVENGFNNAVMVGNVPSGDNIYEVVMEFPGEAVDDIKTVPLEKTLIHLEIDDIQTRVVGFGDNIFAQNYDDVAQTVQPQEAREHKVNFDVGIWSSDQTGGSTARMRAYQILNSLFSGSIATESLRTFSDGGDGPIDILSFAGGKFATERVNDVNVYRTIGTELEVRCYSRTPIATPIPAIEGVTVEELQIVDDLS